MADKNLNTPPKDGLQEGLEGVEGTPIQKNEDGPFNFDELIGGGAALSGFPEAPKPAEKKEDGTPANAVPDPNDAVRFEYFQSQAAKTQNELEALKLQNAQMLEAMNSNKPPVPPLEPVVEDVPQIPEPPKQPERPAYFNREEVGVANTASAKYMDDMEGWRNNMVVHNNKVIQMNAEAQTNQFKQFKEDTIKEAKQKEAVVEQRRQLAYLSSQLKEKYNANDTDIQSFISEMSNPKSVNIDNLWKIHQLNHGVPIQNTQSKNIPLDKDAHKPSADFTQTKKAQQVPGSMGVLPGQNKQELKSVEDRLMDEMIKMEKKENPF